MGNQATVLRPEVLSDLEDSTSFTTEEIRDYYKQFLKDTSHGRMTLSLDEFKELYKNMFPQGDATKFAEHVFHSFDQDGDGRIDFREFLSALSVQQKGNVEQKLEWTFKLYDLDDNGFINRAELVAMLKSINGLKGNTLPAEQRASPEQLADYIMKRADQNKDGQLSRREFVDGAIASETMQRMLVGTLKASGSPFTQRKQYNTTTSNKK